MRTDFLISASVFAQSQAYRITRKRAYTVGGSKMRNSRCSNMANDRAKYRRGPGYGEMLNGKPTGAILSGCLFGSAYCACAYLYIGGAHR